MTSSNGNIFHITGPLCGEFIGHRWIPLTKAGDAELWCFLWSSPEQTVEQTILRLVIWDAIAPIMTSLWWHWTKIMEDVCKEVNTSMKIIIYMYHDDVIKWKHFPYYWPFVRRIPGHRWIPLTNVWHIVGLRNRSIELTTKSCRGQSLSGTSTGSLNGGRRLTS